MSRFNKIRDNLVNELVYYRETCIEDQLEVYNLEEILLRVVDIYQVYYGDNMLLQDELLWLTDLVYDICDIEVMIYEELYEYITRVLILMETIDNRALQLECE